MNAWEHENDYCITLFELIIEWIIGEDKHWQVKQILNDVLLKIWHAWLQTLNITMLFPNCLDGLIASHTPFLQHLSDVAIGATMSYHPCNLSNSTMQQPPPFSGPYRLCRGEKCVTVWTFLLSSLFSEQPSLSRWQHECPSGDTVWKCLSFWKWYGFSPSLWWSVEQILIIFHSDIYRQRVLTTVVLV